MKVVLDTNVVVSSLLNAFGPSAQIMALLLSGELIFCCDHRILREYQEVLLRPKFQFPLEAVEDLLGFLENDSFKVIAKPLSKPLYDTSDEMFLEVAITARADYLITGNLKHFPQATSAGPGVVSPAKFITIYRHSNSP
ncbi:MAG: putative toxin-antitoxin system toxin component, PIN family [Candidatus Omnitrophica bacterium]|nr:putative toxin-antitoxin system toxin component, PIN family [Candidatus Omnitrophota bacterium]